MRRRAALLLTALGLPVLVACSGGGSDAPALAAPEVLERQGGDATIRHEGRDAFAQPIPGLSHEDALVFAVGNSFFNDNWVTAPASTTARDGLGPLFNAQSCSSCHFKDGRGAPPESDDDPTRGLLLRLSVLDADGNAVPHPTLGDQLQDRAVREIAPEGTIRIRLRARPGRYADGTGYTLAAPTYEVIGPDGQPVPGLLISPRVAPAVFGVGLLEAVPAEDLEAAADPDDRDGDGISGRVNHVPTLRHEGLVVGRFGWKANVATVEDQNAGAFAGDIGITSALRPLQPCTPEQVDCLAQPDGGEPEVEDRKLAQVTFYTRTLAVPARRDAGDPEARRGQQRFDSIGCSACHTPELRTGPSDVPKLSEQTIRPYTDLLIHDMGPGLADGRPDAEATGREWRTPPLWGIGLVSTVNRHTRFLHDGRARDLSEAVLWHGGEAAAARDRFIELSADERADLIAFLESL